MSTAMKKAFDAVAHLTPDERSELIDDLLETYCAMCAELLDEDGDCPDGCDPEDLLDDEDDEDEDDEEEHSHAH